MAFEFMYPFTLVPDLLGVTSSGSILDGVKNIQFNK